MGMRQLLRSLIRVGCARHSFGRGPVPVSSMLHMPHERLASHLANILSLRLRQVAAYPLPVGQVVGAFGRALWSLWLPITGREPARPCMWSAGCQVILPEGSHRNLHFCETHLAEAARKRSERYRRTTEPF